ncbi:MAG: hypothetical protein KAI24_04700, partial [Planctomycetes bacterium]|nr:hypothetical protein [Planctomycetota bacterium]
DGRPGRLPRSEDLLDDAWRDAVNASAAARAGFFAATRIPDCRWSLHGDGTFYELFHLSAGLHRARRLVVAAAHQEAAKRPVAAFDAAEALLRFAAHARACPSATGIRLAWLAEAEAWDLLRPGLEHARGLEQTRLAARARRRIKTARAERLALAPSLAVLREDCRRLCRIAGEDYADDLPKVPPRAEALLIELLTAQPGDETSAGLRQRTQPLLDRWQLLANQRKLGKLQPADRVEVMACHLATFVRPQFELLLPAYDALLAAERRLDELLDRSHPHDNGAPVYELAIAELDAVDADLRAALPQRYQRQLTQQHGCAFFGDAGGAEPWRAAVDVALPALALFDQATARRHCRFGAGDALERARRIAVMTRLTAARGWLAAGAGDAERAAACACTLLRHARHVDASEWILHTTRNDLEEQALRILDAALAHPLAGPVRAKVQARTARRLQAIIDGQRDHTLPALLLRELDAMLQLHHARLRDVHQKVEGGYRREPFRARVIAAIGPCADSERTFEAAAWLEAAEARRQQLLREVPDVTTTEKVARGFAVMMLSGAQETADAHRRLVDVAARVRAR